MVTMSNEYQRNYYQKNKEKYKHNYNRTEYCEHCECLIKSRYRSRHFKTKKHQANLEKGSTPTQADVEVKRAEIRRLVSCLNATERAQK